MIKTQGIILNTSDFRDSSKMVTLFSPDYGKIKGVVKAVRKEYLRYPSSLLLFSLNEFIFYPSRSSDLNLISFIDCKDYFSVFSDLRTFSYACLFVYLVDKVIHPGEKNEKAYGLLLESLKYLTFYEDKEKIKFIFILKFLDFTGFRPHILECLNCAKSALLIKEFYLSIKKGGLLCKGCIEGKEGILLSPGALRSLLFFQNKSYKRCLTLGLDDPLRKQIQQILDSFIVYHLDISPLKIFA